MSYLNKKRRKDINIINKPQQWRDFSVDDIKINKPNKPNNPVINGYDQIKNTHKFNEFLLKQAKKAGAEGNWSATSGDKLAVAGSQTKRDWYDNVTKIPFYGDLTKSERYTQLNKALEKNPNVNNLVGHSLGGAVILEKQINNPGKFETTTYNAPVMQMSSTPQGNRYRNTMDPISMFDKGSKSRFKSYNPVTAHSYHDQPDGYASNTILSNGNEILIE